jgi:hypothetical protein
MEAPLRLTATDPVPPAAPETDGTDCPSLRLIPGGPEAARRRRRPAAVYRRRRLGAAALAFVVLLSGLAGARALEQRALDDPAPSVVPAPGAVAPVTASGTDATHRVQPGDTLWTVARRLQPDGDIRPLVDRLAAANGGATLHVGQELDLVAAGRDVAHPSGG